MFSKNNNMTKPYKEHKLSKNTYLRIFSSELDGEHLKWHYDEEDRKIEILNENDWEFQFDDALPFKLLMNGKIHVQKNKIHRLIKGTTNLFVKVIKK